MEAEWDRACREGQELTEELARLRSDVSALDSQLDQCEPTLRYLSRGNLITIKHVISYLVFFFRHENRHLRTEVTEAEEHLVSELEAELARVKADLDAAGQQEHNVNQEDQATADELEQAEAQVRTLRSQMDQLTQEIKQANLQSLSIAPADDLKILLEGNATGAVLHLSPFIPYCVRITSLLGH